MEPTELKQETSNHGLEGAERPRSRTVSTAHSVTGFSSQSTPSDCPYCANQVGYNPNSNAGGFVYALGRVQPRYPTLGVEKEFAQVIGRAETAGLTDRQALHAALSQKQNRYVARKLCWVFTVEGLETYILAPRDPGDLDLLIEAVRPTPRSTDVDLVIGMRGPIAPPELCNGLMLPVVVFDHLYSFDVDSLVKAIPRPEKVPESEFPRIAEELFIRIMQIADNAGATDEHRALNYLAVRYPAIYAKAAEEYAQSASLTAVEVRPAALSGMRKVLEPIFTYTDRRTGITDKFSALVDVDEMFPHLVKKLSSYFDR